MIVLPPDPRRHRQPDPLSPSSTLTRSPTTPKSFTASASFSAARTFDKTHIFVYYDLVIKYFYANIHQNSQRPRQFHLKSPSKTCNHTSSAQQPHSTERSIKGYRPGKASYDTVKGAYGERQFMSRHCQTLFAKHLSRQSPKINLSLWRTVLSSLNLLGNPPTYTATVALVPGIIMLADIGAKYFKNPLSNQKQLPHHFKICKKCRLKKRNRRRGNRNT